MEKSNSLLHLTSNLNNKLLTTLPLNSNSSALIHPLTSSNNTNDNQSNLITIESIKSTFNLITKTIKSFQSNILDSTNNNNNQNNLNLNSNNNNNISTEKYLALLKESSIIESNLLEIEKDKEERKKLLKNRKEEYESIFPIIVNGLNPTTSTTRTSVMDSMIDVGAIEAGGENEKGVLITILEKLSESLGLVSFIDESTTISIPESKLSIPIKICSLGGKAMVVDFDILPAPPINTGEIYRVRITYLINGRQYELDSIAKLLESLLKGVEGDLRGPNAVVGKEADKVESRMKEVRCILKELTRLDNLTQESGLDCFRISSTFIEEINVALHTDLSSITIPHPSSLTSAKILYHASASTLLSPTYQSFISDSTSTKAYNKLSKNSNLNTLSIQIHVQSPKETETISTTYFKIKLEPAVVITKSLGRKLLIMFDEEEEGADKMEVEVENKIELGGLSRQYLPEGITSFESLVFSPEKKEMISPDSIFQLIINEEEPIQNYSLAQPNTIPGFLCNEIKVKTTKQLVKIIKLLQSQLLVTSLIQSILNPHYLLPSSLPPSDPTNSSNLTRSYKKRKVQEITLDDLFDLDKPIPLPIFLHLNPNSDLFSIAITFPSPTLESFQISLNISIVVDYFSDLSSIAGDSYPEVTNRKFKVEILGEGKGIEKLRSEKGLKKLEEVLKVSRHLGLLIRCIDSLLKE